MAVRAFVVDNEVFCQGNGNMLTLGWWSNDEKHYYVNLTSIYTHWFSMKNFKHVKLRYADPCNFLTKHAFVRQPSTLVFAKESNISHYLNLSIYLSKNELSLPLYNTHPHDCPSQMNPNLMISVIKLTLSLIDLLLLINNFFVVSEGQPYRVPILIMSVTPSKPVSKKMFSHPPLWAERSLIKHDVYRPIMLTFACIDAHVFCVDCMLSYAGIFVKCQGVHLAS